MKSYIEKLKTASKKFENIFCLGIDPDLDLMRECSDEYAHSDDVEKDIVWYFTKVQDILWLNNITPSTVKLNYGMFEQYGIPGLLAMRRIIESWKEIEVPVILDVKRCDVSHSSAGYANAAYEKWGADAVTVVPFAGNDGISCYNETGKGVYVWCRGSNPTANELQKCYMREENLEINISVPMFIKVAELIEEKWFFDGIGAVVGGTDLVDLEWAAKTLKRVPLLIPGVGRQGGKAKLVYETLQKIGYDLSICRVSASRSVTYPDKPGNWLENINNAVKEMVIDLPFIPAE